MTTRSRITLFLAATLLAASAAAAGAITDVRIQNAGAAQSNVPVTFGQVFAAGDMRKADVLVGKLDGDTVPLQVDVKATHADGSVRHAIISAIVPSLKAGATGTMSLNTGGIPATAGISAPVDLLTNGFTASASATIAGVKYSASADQLLKAGVKATWLAGTIANEWQVSAPLATAAGVAHPHLTARFAVRYYGAAKKARVDVTIENAWAYEPGPQNFTYDAEILVGGKSVYSKAGLTHLHHARWRKLFWWGGEAPAVNVQSNVPYLISSRAVPNYDQSVLPAEKALAAYGALSVEPMGLGLSNSYMPMTGGNDGIGILPAWTTAYVLSMDSRARNATLATADGAGSYSMHYRDRKTDRPVTLTDHPRMTIAGRSTDAGADAFPGPGGDIASPFTHDIAHQPSLAYLPYLVTGDYFYLEEMQFWALYDAFASNPGYRGAEQGLVIPEQLRGQAWALRTLVQAAYATPDADPIKSELVRIAGKNFEYYNRSYSNNAAANKLGVITDGYAIDYENQTAMAPWMDDFFTSAIGHAVELGFDNAKPLLAWKAKFPVGRMTAPGACWITAAAYGLHVRDVNTGPIYDTFAQAFGKSLSPEFMALPCGSREMAEAWNQTGYPMNMYPTPGPGLAGDMGNVANGNLGYPSNMQPALAYSADSGIPGATQAWTLFANRVVRPDYSLGAQFNIVPRDFVAVIATPAAPAPAPTVPAAPAAPAAPVVTAVLVAAPTAAGTWAKIADENNAFTVPAGTVVRYGVGSTWLYSTGSGVASNAYFGRDPAANVVKTAQAFTPVPAAKQGKVTTPSNTKLKSMKGLTLTFFDVAKLSLVKSFAGVATTSKGVATVSDVALAPGATYAVVVADANGKVLDVLYPVTAQ